MKKLILYHKNCEDGFGAAYAAWKKFRDEAEYIAVNPQTLPERFPTNREIYAMDISYDRKVQEKLRKKNKSLVILDHHISRKEDTLSFPENVFKNNHSGSVLAWEYFHPRKKIPKLLLHIEDVDLWNWRMPGTQEVTSSLGLLDFDFRQWDRFARKLESPSGRKKILEEGKIISRYERKMMERLAEKALPGYFGKNKVLVVNTPVLVSDIGNLLLQKNKVHVIVLWSQRGDGIRVSLRSDGKVDVSKIAARHGGGGHKKASGFAVPKGEKVPWKI